MKYYIKTTGCPVNEVDSSLIKHTLEKLDYVETSYFPEADILILNGCYANNQNVKECFKELNDMYDNRKSNSIIGVSGCFGHAEKNKIFNLFPDLNFCIGTFSYHKLEEIIKNHLKQTEEIISAGDKAQIYKDNNEITISSSNPNKMHLLIQEGCNNFCSYCIIPYIRGREYSKPLENAISEAKQCSVPILDIAGQNIGRYQYGLSTLLKELLKLNNFQCISCINPLHPNEVNKELLDLFLFNDRIIQHLEISAQSGSNRILKLMNRKYDIESFYKIYDYCKDYPMLTLGTDIIVGFPDETEEDFEKTLELLKTTKMFNVNIYTYRKMEGTPASNMDNQIPEYVKNQRKEICDKICEENYKEYIKYALGKIYKNCVVESYNNIEKAPIVANIKLLEYIESEKCFIGEIV